MKARLNTANTRLSGQCICSLFQNFSFLRDSLLTDVELVSEVPDANTRELSADKAEDPVGCDCGGCTPRLN